MADEITGAADPVVTIDPNAVVAPAAVEAPAPSLAEQVGIAEPIVPVVEQPGQLDEGGTTYSYDPTGSPGLDVALDFIGNLGLGGTDPAVVAAANGDFTLLEAKLAALGDKARGWERMVALGKAAQADSAAQTKATQEQSAGAILTAVGGQENWDAIKAWAGANADPDEKKQINQMIELGPFAARAAATLLLGAYKAAPGTTINPANPALNAAGGTVATTGPLNATEYSAAVRELRTKLGSRFETSNEYAALQRRLR